MTCPEALRTQAYFDGEMDASTAAEVEHHLTNCSACRALLDELAQGQQEFQSAFTFAAPAALRARIATAIDALEPTKLEPKKMAHKQRAERLWLRPFWTGAFSGGGAGFAIAMLAAFLLFPSKNGVVLDGLVAEHMASLLPGHLIAVESSDHHTVKPWFAGRTDVSPVVADFAAEGFTLVGGRSDYVARQRAAVVVYRHAQHVINVFSWRDNDDMPLQDTSRDGYRMAFWKFGGLRYCAVSDASWETLHRLGDLLRNRAAEER